MSFLPHRHHLVAALNNVTVLNFFFESPRQGNMLLKCMRCRRRTRTGASTRVLLLTLTLDLLFIKTCRSLPGSHTKRSFVPVLLVGKGICEIWSQWLQTKHAQHAPPPPSTHTLTLTSFNSGASGFQWHFNTFQFQWLTRGAVTARASAHTA